MGYNHSRLRESQEAGSNLVGWRLWWKALQGMAPSIQAPEKKPNSKRETQHNALGKATQVIECSSCPHHYENNESKTQSLCEHSFKVFEIPALAFIKAHTSGFALAFFMTRRQSLSTMLQRWLSTGSCLLMSSELKIGSKQSQERWQFSHSSRTSWWEARKAYQGKSML